MGETFRGPNIYFPALGAGHLVGRRDFILVQREKISFMNGLLLIINVFSPCPLIRSGLLVSSIKDLRVYILLLVLL